ncbi:hypothetical protein INQ41_00090 [Lysobacter ciconiae]|uniref:Fap n=1 Tax=Novilysobacter ciconiae TaxID=2781022 RepID=A0A7S6UFX9_9GAMM|nr:hypothetical protein [Lysobacter ciconiae]QOW19546.1 hypothetical protein INQ41_00090 [Lysobacter ciconiae]
MRYAITTPAIWVPLLLTSLVLMPATASASGARKGVQARHGEMVILRNVSARHAVRPMPPGMALIVEPSPKRNIDQSLGTGELSDEEYASLGAGSTSGPSPVVAQVTGRALAPLGAMTSTTNGAVSGNGIHQAVGVSMGAVGNVTRGVGDQVRGALAQFPLVSPPVGAPPPGG